MLFSGLSAFGNPSQIFTTGRTILGRKISKVVEEISIHWKQTFGVFIKNKINDEQTYNAESDQIIQFINTRPLEVPFPEHWFWKFRLYAAWVGWLVRYSIIVFIYTLIITTLESRIMKQEAAALTCPLKYEIKELLKFYCF